MPVPDIESAVASIDAESSVELLRLLIRTRSTNPPGDEIHLARKVRDMVAELGLEVDLMPFDEGRANLVARLKGRGDGPGLIFSAHFDTVPEGEAPWEFPPYEGVVRDGRVFGRGAADMKGGMAAMLKAAEALARHRVAIEGDLILAFTSGETSNCIGARRLVEAGMLEDAGAFLVSEPTGLEVCIAEKAALWLSATAAGRTSHGSQPHAGVNAIEALARFLVALEGFDFGVPPDPLLGAPTIAVGTIRGGVAINVTPDRGRAELDIRLLPDQDPAAVTARLQALAGARITVEPIDFKPAVVTPPDHPFVGLCREAQGKELGQPRPPQGASYFTDGAVIAHALELPMVILGPGEMEMSHQPNENVEVEKLVAAARMFTRIAAQYLG